MYFSEAFKLMENGLKVKLPSWGGYWYWSQEKKTIIVRRGNQIPEERFQGCS